MADIAEIKGRMNSIAETKKVTDAMYMISSVKLRRAKRELESTMPYFDALREQITDLFRYIPETENRYFHASLPEGKEHFRHGILLVTSDKGLAGSYNHTAIKVAEEYMSRHPETELFIVGEYGWQHFKSRSIPFHEEFRYSAAFPSIGEAEEICVKLLSLFDTGVVDEISIIYTDYQGARPSLCKRNVLLPLDKSTFQTGREDSADSFKEFFPDVDTVLNGVVPSYLTGFIYSSLVDSYCSEQQARMLAMSTAGNNAEEMLKKLRMEYNSIRQASITNEMIEITSGAAALRAKHKKIKEEDANE
ncbi:MAG: ATP synthase F1 subunit gamma [Eubacteriales bacterium]|nr:ATP synthase F1 subunit gamma [Eubacteriales bacterium]